MWPNLLIALNYSKLGFLSAISHSVKTGDKVKNFLKRAGQTKPNSRSSLAPAPQDRSPSGKPKARELIAPLSPPALARAGRQGKPVVPGSFGFPESRSCPGRGSETFTTCGLQGRQACTHQGQLVLS